MSFTRDQRVFGQLIPQTIGATMNHVEKVRSDLEFSKRQNTASAIAAVITNQGCLELVLADLAKLRADNAKLGRELDALTKERDGFYLEYRSKYDVETKALYIEREALRAALEKLPDAIAKKIEADVTDRRGWRQEWGQFEPSIKKEIRNEWRKIIRREIELALASTAPAPKPEGGKL